MSEGMKRVVVIGAGTMGNGIAHVFAQSGHTVTLVDVQAAALERAQATIDRNLDRLVAKERLKAEDKAATLSRLTTSTEMHGAVSDADLVVEAATERAPDDPIHRAVDATYDDLGGVAAAIDPRG